MAANDWSNTVAWHVSLTLKWPDLNGTTDGFLDFCESAIVPFNQVRIPKCRFHSTLYAFAKIKAHCEHYDSMREASLEVLRKIQMMFLLNHQLGALPRFKLSPSQLKHSSHSSTIQFKTDTQILSRLRQVISESISSQNNAIKGIDIDFPPVASEKNSGALLWGAIARIPAPPPEKEILQQKRDISGEYAHFCFCATKALLTISDDAFTNHLEQGDSVEINLS